MGAYSQARREADIFQERAASADKISDALLHAETMLERAERAREVAQNNMSLLRTEINELKEARESADMARSELMRCQAEHAGEIKALNWRFIEQINELNKSFAEERSGLKRRLDKE